MTLPEKTIPNLSFNGSVIHDRGDMLSLTDMWRAHGSDPARQPSNWLASADAKRFVETLNFLEPGNSGVQSKRGGRGVGGSTFADWQIAMAYAKYLSPEFHMWCNTVVRERMEGRSISTAGLPADVLELISRTDGISRMLSHKVTEMEKGLAAILDALPVMIGKGVETAIAADPRRAVLAYVSVRQMLDEAKALPKGRRSLNRRVGNELRNRAVLTPPAQPVSKCPHSGVWLFPRDFAAAFMRERGHEMVKAHNDKTKGQGILKLALRNEAMTPAPI